MRRSSRAIAGLLAIILALGCGDDEGAAPDPDFVLEDLVGTWDAAAFKYTSRTNTAVSYDIVEAGGLASMTVGSDGEFSVVVLAPGDALDVISGSLTVEDGIIVAHDSEENETLSFEGGFVGTTLSMRTPDAEFDFIGNGNEEPAILEMAWEPTEGASVGELAGSWDGTKFLFISAPSETDTVDVLADGGALGLTIEDDGSYLLGMALPDKLPAVEMGTLLIDGSRLIFINDSPFADPAVFNFSRIADTLFLGGEGDYDFDDDGDDDPADIDAELERQAASASAEAEPAAR
jgi:hypothetical protein